ncbi:MAG: hypothetical protein H3C41_09800 [Bacteroidales bacterium]|nr:hypothetical protein [Bacteroidales bacterium]
MEATKQQLKVFHAILAKRGLMDMKPIIVSDESSGRTEHASQLTVHEMAALIKRLQVNHELRFDTVKTAENRMRRRILSLCYSLGWTRYDEQKRMQTADMERLEAWLQKYGYLHKKKLNDYAYNELVKLVTQFEMFTKSELQ